MATSFPRSARSARRGAAQTRASRELQARRRELERAKRRLPHPIMVRPHAIERWQERVDPSMSAGAAEGEIARFVRTGRVIHQNWDGTRYMGHSDWPGVRLVVAVHSDHLAVVTVHPNPRLARAG